MCSLYADSHNSVAYLLNHNNWAGKFKLGTFPHISCPEYRTVYRHPSIVLYRHPCTVHYRHACNVQCSTDTLVQCSTDTLVRCITDMLLYSAVQTPQYRTVHTRSLRSFTFFIKERKRTLRSFWFHKSYKKCKSRKKRM